MTRLVIEATDFADICDVSVYNIELWYDIELKSSCVNQSLIMETIEFHLPTLKKDVVIYARGILRSICRCSNLKTYGHVFFTQPFHEKDKYCAIRIAVVGGTFPDGCGFWQQCRFLNNNMSVNKVLILPSSRINHTLYN